MEREEQKEKGQRGLRRGRRTKQAKGENERGQEPGGDSWSHLKHQIPSVKALKIRPCKKHFKKLQRSLQYRGK